MIRHHLPHLGLVDRFIGHFLAAIVAALHRNHVHPDPNPVPAARDWSDWSWEEKGK